MADDLPRLPGENEFITFIQWRKMRTELLKKVEYWQQQCEQVEKEKCELKKKIDEFEKEKLSKHSSGPFAQETNDGQNAELIDELNDEIVTLQRFLRDKDIEISNLQKERKTLKQTYVQKSEDIEKENCNLQRKIEKLEKENKLLNKKTEEQTIRKETSGKETQELQKALSDSSKQLTEKTDENNALQRRTQEQEEQIKLLNAWVDELVREKDELVRENKCLSTKVEKLILKECNKNCVARVVLWLCEDKELGLNAHLCGRQIEKIIMAQAHMDLKVQTEDLKCDNLMSILDKCGIVEDKKGYEYPSEKDAKKDVINEVWNELMRADVNLRVIILGRVISKAEGSGHVEVFDLRTRKDEGTVTIYNPQEEVYGHGNREDFLNYLMNDEGLILYKFNHDKLMKIIRDRGLILHRRNKCNQHLPMETSGVNKEE